MYQKLKDMYLIRVISEHFPDRNLLSELLVDYHYNTHDVGGGESARVEIRPQVQF